jgi:hypothetical protein
MHVRSRIGLPAALAFGYDAAMRHFPLRECGYAVGFILITAAIYVAAYYAAVVRTPKWSRLLMCERQILFHPEPAHAEYPADILVGFFAPMHEVDRKIRPHFRTVEGVIQDHWDWKE